MNGIRAAVFGLGRSGLAAARALKQAGADPTVFDERPADSFAGSPLLAALNDEGIAFVPGFSARWTPANTDLVVTSPGVPKTHSMLVEADAARVEVIGEIELAYRVSRAPIVGITGTNGKSTTTLMTHLCLEAAGGGEPVLCGNIYGSGYPEIPLTEAALNSRAGQILVAEISSFQLEWVRDFAPKAAIITNLSEDHLNRYASFEEYAASKHRIFRQMGEADTAVWHRGDAICEPFGAGDLGLGTKRKAGLGQPSRATFGAAGAEVWADEEAIHTPEGSVSLADLPFGETHNVLNAMAAIQLAWGASGRKVSRLDLAKGLRSFKGLAHRMEQVGERDGVLLINNSMCTNPGAVIASSQGLRRRQHLLIGGINKEMDYAPLRAYLDGAAHDAYLFGTDGPEIARQLGGRWPVFSTLRDAFSAAVARAKAGEAVMLAPGAASTDQFKDFRDRGEAFRSMAKEWLER